MSGNTNLFDFASFHIVLFSLHKFSNLDIICTVIYLNLIYTFLSSFFFVRSLPPCSGFFFSSFLHSLNGRFSAAPTCNAIHSIPSFSHFILFTPFRTVMLLNYWNCILLPFGEYHLLYNLQCPHSRTRSPARRRSEKAILSASDFPVRDIVEIAASTAIRHRVHAAEGVRVASRRHRAQGMKWTVRWMERKWNSFVWFAGARKLNEEHREIERGAARGARTPAAKRIHSGDSDATNNERTEVKINSAREGVDY